jgi:hypothetical protein
MTTQYIDIAGGLPQYGVFLLLHSSILAYEFNYACSEGKINEKHYESLRNEISILYEEIFRKKIDLLDSNPSNNKATQEQLSQIRNEAENAYSRGKISEKHYDLLNKAISSLESKEE